MKYPGVFFLLIGLLAIGISLRQPPIPQAQSARIETIMARHGYAPSGRFDIGKAVMVTKFSSAACGGVRIMPVSIQFQESALLRQAETAGEEGAFVYMRKSWNSAASNRAALSYVSQRFLQMVRLRPNPAIDTMLYIVSPRGCGPARFDWSDFWSTAI